jgi:hypothetical protein
MDMSYYAAGTLVFLVFLAAAIILLSGFGVAVCRGARAERRQRTSATPQ